MAENLQQEPGNLVERTAPAAVAAMQRGQAEAACIPAEEEEGEGAEEGRRPRVVARREYILTARDLVSFVPSLQVDAVNCIPNTAQDPAVQLPPGPSTVALGFLRGIPERKRALGAREEEIHADGLDSACYWEEARLRSALRDLEPAARVGLLRRVYCSVDLELRRGATTAPGGDDDAAAAATADSSESGDDEPWP